MLREPVKFRIFENGLFNYNRSHVPWYVKLLAWHFYRDSKWLCCSRNSYLLPTWSRLRSDLILSALSVAVSGLNVRHTQHLGVGGATDWKKKSERYVSWSDVGMLPQRKRWVEKVGHIWLLFITLFDSCVYLNEEFIQLLVSVLKKKLQTWVHFRRYGQAGFSGGWFDQPNQWEQIPSGTCLVPLSTGAHNPLIRQVVPLAPWVLVARPRKHGGPAGFVPAILSRCLDSSSSSNLDRLLVYLRSLIQATSWSGAGPDLICCQREACLWADGPLWSRSSSSSSYKLASFTCCCHIAPAASC